MKAIVDQLARLSADSWHKLAVKMAWYYRTEGKVPVPAKAREVFGGNPPDQSTWQEVRVAVTRIRKRLKLNEERLVARKKLERRRAYMRKYMSQYRKGTSDG